MAVRLRGWRAPVLPAAAVLALLAPGSASGVSVSHAEFDAALTSTSATAGVFAKGTTLVVFAKEPMTFHTLTFSINPDGSFVRQEKSFDDVLKAHRCVRINRCWGLDLGAFGNLKWHRLPAETVHYRQARDWWATWLDIEWPEGTAFDVTAGADGSQVFTATVPYEDGRIWTSVTTFAGASLTSVDTSTRPGGDPEQTMVMTMSARVRPVRVLPPPERLVGRPVTRAAPFQVQING
jgi:hypothetical protein